MLIIYKYVYQEKLIFTKNLHKKFFHFLLLPCSPRSLKQDPKNLKILEFFNCIIKIIPKTRIKIRTMIIKNYNTNFNNFSFILKESFLKTKIPGRV